MVVDIVLFSGWSSAAPPPGVPLWSCPWLPQAFVDYYVFCSCYLLSSVSVGFNSFIFSSHLLVDYYNAYEIISFSSAYNTGY